VTDFQREEQKRAYVRVVEHLTAALAHLMAACSENHKFALGLDLPPQKPITDAIHQCAHVYKQPGETPA
jgi:hypothetical protein